MESTATTSNIQDFASQTDKQDSNYEIKEIGTSIFKRAENKEEVLFLMGNNIIQQIKKTEKWWLINAYKTERELNQLNTKLLIPIIAAMAETVELQKKQAK